MTTAATAEVGTSEQERSLLLKLFDKSVLKKAKYGAIVDMLPDVRDATCLDVGADNGVISYLLRQRGGQWHSADLDDDVVRSIRKMVGDRVYRFDGGRTQFEDAFFDVVIIIDFLEHIDGDAEFVQELRRILKPDGVLIVNVPHDKPGSPIRKLRLRLGLTDEKHGHVRPGYTLSGLTSLMDEGFVIERHHTYSRFFVELFDVAVSAYFDRAKKGHSSSKGNVVTGDDLRKHAKQFKLFSLVYPLVWCLAQLDRVLPFGSGYSLIVRTRRRDDGDPQPGHDA